MISGEKIPEDIFKILKGNGHNIKIFTDEGENTIDPEAARRFYIPELGSMINLDETDSKREIRVSINANTDINEFKDTLALLKNLANKSIVEYTLKSLKSTLNFSTTIYCDNYLRTRFEIKKYLIFNEL